MNIKELIPKDKFDIDTAQRLQNFSFEEIKPIIPDLLKWLQDMNWPVSGKVADFLIPFSDDIADEILQILKTDDEVWKYWLILNFGRTIKNELVVNEIKRIAKNPTEAEVEDGVCEVAKEIFQQ